ncbi:MAG: DUF4492 domain-containing protein [Proteobacteria bacterium]|nr:DUF4492 domain-containing protein [Desulfocapsa sp.]MBU3946544.1 DUF4492 domain-containing protein [Pseudomonadota bacterium]MDO8946114.1 DUF4492 domain-containing protein [Desulfocapsaceae bacterium]MBU3982385.1 DUF4492 domain-containing protein [Pseudomonadota bacterium]MBU4028402.1 DUF4492 domain-containing protein [Pseudomonadota bacterium]
MLQPLTKVYSFYRNGFRTMTVGKTLWKIILIKLLVMFAVLKLFFFPNYLKTNFQTDEQRADHVLEQLSRPVVQNH